MTSHRNQPARPARAKLATDPVFSLTDDGWDSSAVDRDPFDLVGDVIDSQFRVEEVAGEGHLTVVYRGHHLGVDAPVAIKCLHLPSTLDPALLAPIVRNFREGSRLHYRLSRDNRHIVQTLASGTTMAPRSGVEIPYLVREWLDGHPLAIELAWRRARSQKGLPLEEALSLLEGAFDGLAFAHARGSSHLSVNASNLFVVTGAKARHVRIVDFGLAAAMGQGISELPGTGSCGLQLVSAQYAAPEQIDKSLGPVGPQTDVHALALLLLEVLAGHPLMEKGEATADRVLDPKKRPTPRGLRVVVPRPVEKEIERALSLAPKDRHPDAGAFWTALDRARKLTVPTQRGIAPKGAEAGAAKGPVAAPPPVEPPRNTLVGVPPLDPAPAHTFELAEPPTSEPLTVAESGPRPIVSFHESSASQETPVAVAIPLPPSRTAEVFARPRNVAALGIGCAALVVAVAVFARTLGGSGAPLPVAAVAVAPPVVAAAPALAPPTAMAKGAETPPPAVSAVRPATRFDRGAAVRALLKVDVASCRVDGKVSGKSPACVRFAPTGEVEGVYLSPPYRGTPEGACVTEKLSAARLAPFTGDGIAYLSIALPK